MPLVSLITPADSPEAISSFSFAHARDHDLIDAALLARGVISPAIQLDPMPTAGGPGTAWLMWHFQKHLDMNNALGLDTDDLTQFDLSKREDLLTFIGTNYSEHDSVHQTLGISE
jgi:hypothetical protein